MTYSQKLRDPRWQRKRLEILSRDNWACKFCSSTNKNLQVHHVVYKRNEPWEYPDYLYQTLCEDCHAMRQELTDKSVDALRIAIKEIPNLRIEIVARRLIASAFKEVTP